MFLQMVRYGLGVFWSITYKQCYFVAESTGDAPVQTKSGIM